MWIVCILKCSDNTYYVGCTGNIVDRLVRHNRGEVHYTSSRLPFEVVHQSVFLRQIQSIRILEVFEIWIRQGVCN
ncbi:MAG: GIY-YIG nuclease family protein [Cytophagaceae bacterium]